MYHHTAATTINASFLAGAVGIVRLEREGREDGLQNFPRFHENWSLPLII